MKPHWTRKLKTFGACEQAIEWAKDYPSFARAWKACANPDWMLWLLPHVGAGHRDMVELACTFAESAEPYAIKYPAVAQCNATVRAWLAGTTPLAEVVAAGDAARAAAWAAAREYFNQLVYESFEDYL